MEGGFVSWYERQIDEDGRLWVVVRRGPCVYCSRTDVHRHPIDPEPEVDE